MRVAVCDCSVTERRRRRPPYQICKTVHVDAKYNTHLSNMPDMVSYTGTVASLNKHNWNKQTISLNCILELRSKANLKLGCQR